MVYTWTMVINTKMNELKIESVFIIEIDKLMIHIVQNATLSHGKFIWERTAKWTAWKLISNCFEYFNSAIDWEQHLFLVNMHTNFGTFGSIKFKLISLFHRLKMFLIIMM